MCDSLPVRSIQRIEDLSRVFHRLYYRQWTSQRVALDELHHQIIGTDVVEMADVWMVQRRYYPRFLRESLAEAHSAHLDCDLAREPRVSGPVDLAHAACGDERFNAVGTKELSRLQRGWCSDQLPGRSPRFEWHAWFVMHQQVFDFTPQLRVATTGLTQIGV